MLAEGFDQLPKLEQDFLLSISYDKKRIERAAKHGFGYYLDNCGDDVWYCMHCLQPNSEKKQRYLKQEDLDEFQRRRKSMDYSTEF